MNPSRARPSHAATWMLAFIVALPVLYVLCLPPVVFLTFNHRFDLRSRGMLRGNVLPDWMMQGAGPYEWLMEREPFKKPLTAYADWWSEKTVRPHTPPP